MQEGEFDYYDEEYAGCCLVCEQAEHGCLCYDCKCTKCLHYSPPEEFEEGGSCDIASAHKTRARERRKKISESFSEDAIDYMKLGLKEGQTQLCGSKNEGRRN